MSNYYMDELQKVQPNTTQYPEKLKVFANGNGQDTRFIDLNEESAKALINWLEKNYINKQ
jgi:hypothetical protein